MLKLIATSLLLLCAAACSSDADDPGPSHMVDLSRVTPEQLQMLTQRTIYFGHQSLGTNILQGFREVMSEKGVPLRIVSGASPSAGVLNEFEIGANGDPDSKNSAFLAKVQGELGANPVLMFKYCFADIDGPTDAGKLFEQYQRTVAAMRAKHPEAVIVHVTFPLTTDAPLRNYINELLGRPSRRVMNAVRSRYNELLRAAYAGKEPIFDIATVESTRADGRQQLTVVAGEPVYSMAHEWTSDEGHLNERGRRRAGEQLLATLASLPRPAANTTAAAAH